MTAKGTDRLQKRAYFNTLSHNQLVSLLLHATNLHPSLPIFPQGGKAAMDLTSSLKTTNAMAHGDVEMTNHFKQDQALEFGYDEDLPYPKAGNGIVLPPESEDMEWLVDDDYETFSHTVHSLPVHMRQVVLSEISHAAGTMGNITSGRSNGVLSVGA